MRAGFSLLGLALVCTPLHAAQAPTLPGLSSLLKDAVARWQAPGLAAVIVHNDRVLLCQAFGVRTLGAPDPVTLDTVFPLASCTKSFTTLALAMLVDEGKLGWDDPVRRHLAYFRLADPVADAGVTLRDLVCHRTGVAPHDPLWYQAPWPLEERIRRAGKLELAVPFRAGFQYQTVLFGAAGVAAARAARTSWPELIQTRVLEPLDMNGASCNFPKDSALPLASPHRRGDDGKVRLIERYPLHEPDPAGSLHASIRDLERYLRFQLGDGTWHGRRLLSERSLVEPHTPQVVVRLEGFTELMNPETRFLTYGLGWIVQDYRGKRILMHGGAIDGFRAHLTLVPEEKLGIALLNNLDGSYLNLALSNQILDLYWGAPPRDWNAFYLAIHEEDRKLERERARRLRAEKRGPPPPLPLADYTGTFTDAAYGDCTVVLHEGRLRWRWSSHDCPLEAFNGNTFLMNQPPLTDILVTFEPGADGRLAEMRALSRVFRRQR